MSGGTVNTSSPPSSVSLVVRIGLLLTLVVVVFGSVRFARYDWTGLPVDRAPLSAERQVSPECLELIGTYTTESGRVVEPVVVDEQQYMALVQQFRGVPESELQRTCLYDPFSYRSGVSWLAHLLPFEEGLALGVTNVVLLIASVWLVLFTLRAQGFGPRPLLAAGVLFTVGWNTFYFGSGLLVETGVLFAVSLGWYLIATRRPWWLIPVLLLGFPLKETVGILVPVVAAWAWQEHRKRGRPLTEMAGLTIAAAIAFVVGLVAWRGFILPEPDAAWEVTIDIDDIINNLTDVISLASFAVGVGPLLIPAALQFRRDASDDGWLDAVLRPATVGVLITVGICVWSFLTVDLTPRLFWMGFPFAASMAAQWFSAGQPKEWLDDLKLPAALRT